MACEEKQFIDTWKSAAAALKFRIISPYDLDVSGTRKTYPVYVPDFGGPKGMLVLAADPPQMAADSEAIRLAESQGFGVSIMNAQLYSRFEPDKFTEVLRDWGFCGPRETKPDWLNED